MTETEIERLVVRLVGDSTSYVKMLTDAQQKTQDAAKQVEQAASKIEKMQRHLEGFASTATKVLGAAGITLGFKALYDQFDKADDTINELSAVIRANGSEVDKVLPKYRAFAEEMTKVTHITSKNAIMELAKQAESLGLSGERAQKAIKTAITLGAMKDADPSSFMRQAVNFEKTGNAAGLARILGLMGELEEDTTKAAEAAKLLEKNWDLVIVKGEDGGTRIERSLNQIKSIGKDAGEIIARSFEPLIVHLESAAKWFNSLDPAVRKTIATFVVLTATIYPAIAAYGILAPKILAVAAALKAVSLAMLANPFAAAAVIALTAAMIALTYHTNKYNEAIAKSKELGSKVVGTQIKNMGQMDPAMKEKERLSYEAQLNKAKDDLERMETASVGRPGMSSLLPGVVGVADLANKHLFGGSEEIEQQKQKIKELQEVYDAFVADRNNAMKVVPAQTGPSKETLDGIKSLNETLLTQINTLGMSEAEVKVYELRLKAAGDAAAQADLDVAEYNARMLEVAKAQKAAADSAKDLEKSLQLQVKTLGMTEREAAKVKLEMEGVDAGQIARIDNLYKEIEVWEAMEEALKWGGDAAEKTKEQFQSLNAVVAGGADAAQLIYQYANQFGADAGAVNKAATLRGSDFKASFSREERDYTERGTGPSDPRWLTEGTGPQLRGADDIRDLQKKLDEQTNVLKQIRDKEQIALEGADLVA